MKLTLNAPGSKRLIKKYDQLLSNLAYSFNLRRYHTEMAADPNVARDARRETLNPYTANPINPVVMGDPGMPSPVMMANPMFMSTLRSSGSQAGAYTRPHLCSTLTVSVTDTSRAPHHMGQTVLTVS
jgi:hypothetical protein